MELQAKQRLRASPESEIQRLKTRNKKIQDNIWKYKDWNTTGGYDKRIAEMRKQLAENKARITELSKA